MGKLLFALCLLVALCSAACTKDARGKRRAWHTFSTTEKKAYIDAELCLMKKPATLKLPGATNRHEELQVSHQAQSYATHFTGSFLPWHRAMIYAHETALRTECNYTGWQPYWQEQLDAGKFAKSVLLDPVTGFGGGGSGSQGCITTGPFKDYVNHIGPYYTNTNHCINRQLSEMFSAQCTQKEVNTCLAKANYVDMWNCVEGMPHQGGHGGVGGLMIDPIASPGDPLFYLHHTWLDKIWADWQQKGLPGRLTEMGGENVQNLAALPFPFPARPSNIPQPTGAEGDPGKVTTLTHKINMYGNGPNRTINDVMNIWDGVLCYEYVEPGAASVQLPFTA